MFELSEDRIKNDEMELHFYGFCSTEIYIQYRKKICTLLKTLMVELSKFYDERDNKDPECVDRMLTEQYQAFWAAAEPSLEKFYENIQNALALPKSVVPKNVANPKNLFCDSEIMKLDNEIQGLEVEFMREKLYLLTLEQRQQAIETDCLSLKNQSDSAAKLLRTSNRRMEHFDCLEAKRVEKLNKHLAGLETKSLLMGCIWAGENSEAKKNENMKDIQIRKEKRGEKET